MLISDHAELTYKLTVRDDHTPENTSDLLNRLPQSMQTALW